VSHLFPNCFAGDVLEKKHDGLVFATSDKDTEDKCAVENKSGWWFHSKKSKGWCDYVSLIYVSSKTALLDI